MDEKIDRIKEELEKEKQWIKQDWIDKLEYFIISKLLIEARTEIVDLRERVKELENEKSYWNCPIHGESQNAWGCPECTVELRTRVKELEEERKGMVRLTEAQMKKLGWSHT